VALDSSAKPSQKPRLGLRDDSRTTDSGCKTVQNDRGAVFNIMEESQRVLL